jgi:uncharacterized damage-inducible protein DinB
MSLDLASYVSPMAHYNQWMNRKLYAAAGALSDEQRKRDEGLFFRSIHGTLNHLLLADKIWLGRFTGFPFPAQRLDQELFARFDELRDDRETTDHRLIDWAAHLPEQPLPARLIYTSLSVDRREVDFRRAIIHCFNHQTHHRGQVTAALSRLGVDVGATDLIAMPED